MMRSGYLTRRECPFSLLLMLIVIGTCFGRDPGNRVFDGSTIPDRNAAALRDIRAVAPSDAVRSGVPVRRWSEHSTDQPVGILLWQWLGIDDTECVSAIEDVNDDGYPDVLAENFDAGASGNNFTCLSGHVEQAPEVIWSVHPVGGPSNSGGSGDQCVNAISDLNGDGYSDALLGTAWGGRTVFAINGWTGATLWSYDTYNDPNGSGWVYSVAPIEDVDGDSVADVLAGVGSTTRSAFCFSGATGNMLWRLNASDAIGSVHQIADVNGDDIPDALIGAWGNSADRRIYCVSGASVGTASIVWQYQTGGDVQSVASIPDVNNNGVDDVIAASWDDNVYCREGSNGSQIWTHPFGANASRAEVVPDVNGDQVWDVFAGGWSGTVRMISGLDGHLLWNRTLPGGNTWTVYPVGDVDDDGIGDVVAGNSVSGGTGGTVFVLSGVDGNIIWDYVTNGWVNTVRGMADVNGDGLDDVIAGNQGGPGPFVWCFEGDTLAGGLPPTPPLLLSEFMTVSTSQPSVEIYNPTNESVDLGGWKIVQIDPEGVDTAIIDYYIEVEAEGYEVVNWSNTQGMLLPEETGVLILMSPDGIPTDTVGYGGMGGAPAPPQDWSTAKVPLATGGWAERYTLDWPPTWGELNDAPAAELGSTIVVINEAYPVGGEGQAFVELFNLTWQMVDLSGWTIAAGQGYQIPDGVMMGPGPDYVLWESQFPEFFGCGALGDNIYLLNAQGVRVDQMGWWGGWEGDSSWSAVPDGDRIVFDGFNLLTSTDFERTVPTPSGVGVPESGRGAPNAYSFSLRPAYPNPFNAATRILYSLDRDANIRLAIYDILGRDVAILVNGNRRMGLHSVVWKAGELPSGTYFAVLASGREVRTLRMTLLK